MKPKYPAVRTDPNSTNSITTPPRKPNSNTEAIVMSVPAPESQFHPFVVLLEQKTKSQKISLTFDDNESEKCEYDGGNCKC